MSAQPGDSADQPLLGIAFILLGMTCVSVNDMLIKSLSGAYPLHELIFTRSAIGIMITLVIVQFEGGFAILKTRRPFQHLARGMLVVIANMTFFAALAALPLAYATALFFVAPLFITVLSIPFLGEKVGVRRISAVCVGFAGVVVMVVPSAAEGGSLEATVTLFLPVLAALAYALMQLMTRKLGIASKASALAVYIQLTFLVVSSAFFLIAGDGRFAEGSDNASVVFLLRAWQWPADGDLWKFIALGLISGVVGYSLSQAYRVAQAATVAPFEYVTLPLAIFWGWFVFGGLPTPEVVLGIVMIVGAGVYVFVRERARKTQLAAARPWRRH